MADPLRVLHVDDEPLNRALVAAMLARAADPRLRAAIVREASTLASARLAWREQPVDVVLLDVRLPDGSGLELATEIRVDADRGRPVIVALTADADPAGQREARAAGCDDLLLKPYTVDQFEATLARHLPTDADGPS